MKVSDISTVSSEEIECETHVFASGIFTVSENYWTLHSEIIHSLKTHKKQTLNSQFCFFSLLKLGTRVSARGQHKPPRCKFPRDQSLSTAWQKSRARKPPRGNNKFNWPKTSEPTGQNNLATYIFVKSLLWPFDLIFDLWSDIIDTDIWNTVNPIVTVAK